MIDDPVRQAAGESPQDEPGTEPGISFVTPPPDETLTLPGWHTTKKVIVDREQRVQMLMRLIELDRYWR